MIELTKLNKKKFVLNCELIESVESTPDTVIMLRNGKLYIVTEPPEEIVDKTIAFKKLLFGGLLEPQHVGGEAAGGGAVSAGGESEVKPDEGELKE